jgi:hypothetical protein
MRIDITYENSADQAAWETALIDILATAMHHQLRAGASLTVSPPPPLTVDMATNDPGRDAP